MYIGIVTRRCIDIEPSPSVGSFGEIPVLTDVSVRHIFDQVKIHTGFRDLDTARHPTGAVVGLAGGIGDSDSVDDQRIVVKARVLWRRRHRPDAGIVLLHVVHASQIDLHLIGSRRADLEHDTVVREDTRISGLADIARRRDPFSGLRRCFVTC